jgi:hypothetical protein
MSMIGVLLPLSSTEVGEIEAKPGMVDELLERDTAVSVEKMWHALHWLLTGSISGGEEPRALTLLGGREIGPDLGYGPARILSSEQVRVVSRALDELPFDEVFAEFDAEEMTRANVYPNVWDEPVDELREELEHYYGEIVSAYAGAAQRGDAMLLAIR